MQKNYIIDTNVIDEIAYCSQGAQDIIKNLEIHIMSWTIEEIENTKINKPKKYAKLKSVLDNFEHCPQEDTNVFPMKFPFIFLDDEAMKVYDDIKKNNLDNEEKYAYKNSDARIAALAKQNGYIVVTNDKELINKCKDRSIKTMSFSEFKGELDIL